VPLTMQHYRVNAERDRRARLIKANIELTAMYEHAIETGVGLFGEALNTDGLDKLRQLVARHKANLEALKGLPT